MLAVITPVFIPQTKYAEQWQPGVRLARPAVGCVRSLGEKCWSQLMVRAERGNTDTGAECSHCRPAESGLGVITTSSERRAEQ